MEINFIKKTSFLLPLLAATTFAHASIIKEVQCPSISTVSETAGKIDAAAERDGTYIVYTSQPAFYQSQLPWYVGVKTDLDSQQEAFQQGKKIVKNINIKDNEKAYEDGNGHFICLYDPGHVIAVGIAGNIDQDTLFKGL